MDQPGAGSHLIISHGARRAFLQPSFLFPFESPTADCLAYLDDVQRLLPFRFREACFKNVQPTARGNSFRGRKLAPGWLARA